MPKCLALCKSCLHPLSASCVRHTHMLPSSPRRAWEASQSKKLSFHSSSSSRWKNLAGPCAEQGEAARGRCLMPDGVHSVPGRSGWPWHGQVQVLAGSGGDAGKQDREGH